MYKVSLMDKSSDIQHEYIDHLKEQRVQKRNPFYLSLLKKLKIIFTPTRLIGAGKVFLKKLANVQGQIVFYRADMQKMTEIKDLSVDAIVSVSAIEHMSHEQVKNSFVEFKRILKSDGIMAITTSASKDKDWFHEPSKGWCFGEKTLEEFIEVAGAKNVSSNFVNYDQYMAKLLLSDAMKQRIPSYYIGNFNCGLPNGKYEPEYQPVGIYLEK